MLKILVLEAQARLHHALDLAQFFYKPPPACLSPPSNHLHCSANKPSLPRNLHSIIFSVIFNMVSSADESAAPIAPMWLSDYRNTGPSSYLFTVNNFNTIVNNDVPLLESRDFEVQKLNWKLKVFPHGNPLAVTPRSGKFSLNLTLVPHIIPFQDQISLFGRFFLYDAVQDRYLMIKLSGEGEGEEGCTLDQNMSCGIQLDHTFLEENGFLVAGRLTVGVEFVVNYGHSTGEEEFSFFPAKSGDEAFSHVWNLNLHDTMRNEKGEFATEFDGDGGMRWQLVFNPVNRFIILYLLQSEVDAQCYLNFRLGTSESLTADEGLFQPGKGRGVTDILSEAELLEQQQINGHVTFKVVFGSMFLSTMLVG